MALFAEIQARVDAEKVGREFSRMPEPEHEPLSPEAEELRALRLRELDVMAERLRAERA